MRIKLIGITLLLFLITVQLVSCFKSDRVEYYIVKIDSISVPDTIIRKDILTMKIWAIIGSNTSYRFSHYEAKKTIHQLDLTVWGKHFLDVAAFEVIVDWRGKEYNIYPVFGPLFTIKIHQPDGSVLQDTIYVK
jgi:hypothetical protein